MRTLLNTGHTHQSHWLMLTARVIVVALLAGSFAAAAGMSPAGATSASLTDWQLVFADEFSAQTLDTDTWKTAYPWGRDRSSLGERQRYVPDAFIVNRGRLRIVAAPSPRERFAYTSGLISSHASFAQEFGRFEIRAKLPRGQGLWPAFWLLPRTGSWPPEIDVFEALGHQTETVYMTMHWRNGSMVPRRRMATFTGPDFSAGFHTFAVEWSADELVWFVDGVKRYEVRGRSPRGPMYLLANLAVGGAWPGAPDASTRFPAALVIDYIRAFARLPAPTMHAPQTAAPFVVDRRRPWVTSLRTGDRFAKS